MEILVPLLTSIWTYVIVGGVSLFGYYLYRNSKISRLEHQRDTARHNLRRKELEDEFNKEISKPTDSLDPFSFD